MRGRKIIDTPYTQLDRLSHCACSRIIAMSMVSLLHGISDITCGVSKVTYKRQRDTHFLVHSLAVASYRVLSVLYKCAISGTSGSSGLGSVSIEQIERRTNAILSTMHFQTRLQHTL
jgi:hypothetical protein